MGRGGQHLTAVSLAATCKDLSYTLSFAIHFSFSSEMCQVLTWFVVLLMTTKFIFNRRTEALLEMMGMKCKAACAVFHSGQVYSDFGGYTVAGARCLQGTTKGRAEVRRLISILTFSLEWRQLSFSDAVCLTRSAGEGLISFQTAARLEAGWLLFSQSLPEDRQGAPKQLERRISFLVQVFVL